MKLTVKRIPIKGSNNTDTIQYPTLGILAIFFQVFTEEEQAMLSLCNIMSHDDGLANFDPDDRMILRDVEIAPAYNGCENLSKEAKKNCFNNIVSAYIKQEFNLSISKALNLSEPKQVAAFFIIE